MNSRDELNELLAENDAELPEDALEAAAGGESGESYEQKYNKGDFTPWKCPDCGHGLLYWHPLSIEDKTHLLYCKSWQCRDTGIYWVGIEDYRNSVYEYKG